MQFEKSVIFQVTIFCHPQDSTERLHAVVNSKSKCCLRYNGGFRLPEPPALAPTVSGIPQAIHHRSSSCCEQYQCLEKDCVKNGRTFKHSREKRQVQGQQSYIIVVPTRTFDSTQTIIHEQSGNRNDWKPFCNHVKTTAFFVFNLLRWPSFQPLNQE